MIEVRRCSGAVALLAAVAVLAADGSAHASDAAPAVRTALVTFVSFPENLPAYPDPRALRYAVNDSLAGVLVAGGRTVLAEPELEPMMRAWRVRTERDVVPGFLHDLSARVDVQEVVLATWSVGRDRLLVAARGVDPEDGLLRWVVSAEERRASPASDAEVEDEAAADPMPELTRLSGVVSRRLGAQRGTPPALPSTAPALVVLPLRPVGLERSPATLALHCLLRSLLSVRRWRIPDPSGVVSALQDEGFDPLLLDAAGRRFLAERFGAQTLLIPRLVAFPHGATSGGGTTFFDEFAQSGSESSLVDGPLLVSLVAIDAETGRIRDSVDRTLAPRSATGMFGVARHEPMDHRLQAETDRLVRTLLVDAEGGSK